MTTRQFLPGVPGEEIESIFRQAPGKEIESGKLDSPESSAMLAANAFGFFLHRPDDLPPLPDCERAGWPARSLYLEKTIRFPWRGGCHPVPDCLVATHSALIGIESKRFEPFRKKKTAEFAETYQRTVWGDRMKGFERIRDESRDDEYVWRHLDAVQLVKHAFALRSEARPGKRHAGLRPILFYVYAEPERWSDGRPIGGEERGAHRDEIRRFSEMVADDETAFAACSYRRLLAGWASHRDKGIRAHAARVLRCFVP